ncbi:MAG: S-layer homology domain-containing protein [Anaerovoracaceae bacterium]
MKKTLLCSEKIKKMMRSMLAIGLAAVMALPVVSVPQIAHGATFTDIRGHWAESYIYKAASYGIIKGDSEGTFRPDDKVTRAEFTSMVNKTLGNSGYASITFTDVPSWQWYYNDVSKGVAAAFINGYSDNTFRPNDPIQRQEAAVILHRVVPAAEYASITSKFKDKAGIASWASDSVGRIYSKGYMQGNQDGYFNPTASLTRAEAAKILCDVFDNEKIVTSNTTISTKGTTLSNRIYANDVTITSAVGSGDVDLKNCVVLGTLYVYGGGDDTVTVNNTRVANAKIEKSSSSVRVLLKGQTTLNKAQVGKKAILETESLTNDVNGIGYNQVDISSSADVTLRGKFYKVNLVGTSADVSVESGEITTLNVESSARNAAIDINKSVDITTANVSARADFTGSGRVQTMNVYSNNVTYETKPVRLNVGSSVTDADDDDDYDISVSPKNKEDDVDVDTKITITFDDAATKYSGGTLKNTDIPDLIYIRKGSSSGTEISYSASINSAKDKITITPTKDLSKDTKYYIVIPAKKFKIGGTANEAQTTYFYTGDGDDDYDSDDDIEVYPEHKEDNVDVDTDIIIEFDDPVTKYSGATVKNSDIEDLIYIRRSSSTGTKISYSASINSAKNKITISPDSDLKDDTKYYIVIPAKSFKIDGRSNVEQITYFYTGDGDSDDVDEITFDPESGETGVSVSVDPRILFPDPIETYAGATVTSSYLNENLVFRKGGSGGEKVAFSAKINSAKKIITITPSSNLENNTKYYISLPSKKFRSADDNSVIAAKSVTWTTTGGSAATASITPVNGTTNVSVDTSITINFSTTVYPASGGYISSDYVKENIKLTNNATQALVSFNVVSYSGGKIVLQPTVSLAGGTKYTVSVPVNRFKNSSGTYVQAMSSTFTTKFGYDTTDIDKAIADAETIMTGVKVSTDGSDVFTDVKWVTQTIWSNLENALSNAKAIRDTATTTIQVENAVSALQVYTSNFKNEMKSGTKVHPTKHDVLKAAIDAAEVILNDTCESSQNGADIEQSEYWVSSEIKAEFEKTIEAAKIVLDTAESDTEILNTKVKLEVETSSFENTRQKGTKPDPSKLIDTIDSALTLLKSVNVSTDGTDIPSGQDWTTQSAKLTYSDAITAAYTVAYSDSSTQEQLDNAKTALDAATNEFKSKAQKGTKV